VGGESERGVWSDSNVLLLLLLLLLCLLISNTYSKEEKKEWFGSNLTFSTKMDGLHLPQPLQGAV